jgi:hypothetical protein
MAETIATRTCPKPYTVFADAARRLSMRTRVATSAIITGPAKEMRNELARTVIAKWIWRGPAGSRIFRRSQT